MRLIPSRTLELLSSPLARFMAAFYVLSCFLTLVLQFFNRSIKLQTEDMMSIARTYPVSGNAEIRV